ncbi:MAG: PH domain-containing protein [Tissierellia bacterium]|nr:PH domain-containing protein [Tissierellia bacterium]
MILFSLCCAVTSIILYFSYQISLKFERNQVLATHIPPEEMDHPKVQRILRRTKLFFILYLILSLLLSVSLYFISNMAYFIGVLLLIVILPQIGIVRAFYAMRNLKREENWIDPSSKVVVVDTDILTKKDEKLFDKKFFFIGLILTPLSLFIIDQFAGLQFLRIPLYFIAGSVLLSWLVLYYVLENQTLRNFTTDPEKNKKINYFYKTKILNTMVYLSFSFPIVFFITGYLIARNPYDIRPIFFPLLYYAVGIVVLMMVLRQSREKLNQLFQKDSEFITIDDDEYYDIFGMKNPNDPRIIVENRFTLGNTINRGHKKGKIVFYSSYILFVLVLLIPLYFINADIEITVEENSLYFHARPYSDRIDYDEIQSIEIRKDFPENILRVNGTSTEKKSFGNFQIKGLGHCRLYIHRDVKEYLFIRTEDQIYLINDKNLESTKKLYEELRKRSPAIGKAPFSNLIYEQLVLYNNPSLLK